MERGLDPYDPYAGKYSKKPLLLYTGNRIFQNQLSIFFGTAEFGLISDHIYDIRERMAGI